jgi:hypothetical protein
MKWLLACVAVLAAGCSTFEPKPTKTAFPVSEPRDVLGLGISYNWPTMDHALLCEELAKAGCNATDIEFMGLTVSTKHGYRQGGAEALKKDYLSLLKECRKRNLTLIVSIVNDNMHIRKWGQSGQDDLAHWPGECERAAQIVMEAGPANVMVQPVAETQTSQGRAYERRWLAAFNAAGFRTVYNGGSRPSSNGGAWTRAYHSCKLSDLGNGANILLIPDCGTAIDAYTDNGNFNSGTVVNPGIAADFARRGRARGNGVCIYTGTGIKSVKEQAPAIRAIGGVR